MPLLDSEFQITGMSKFELNRSSSFCVVETCIHTIPFAYVSIDYAEPNGALIFTLGLYGR